jgi:hypothetical protein
VLAFFLLATGTEKFSFASKDPASVRGSENPEVLLSAKYPFKN